MIDDNKLKLIIYEIYPNYKKIDSLIIALTTILRAIQCYFFDDNNIIFNNVLTLNNFRNLKSIIMNIFYYIKPENLPKFTEFKDISNPELTNIRREFEKITSSGENKFQLSVTKISVNDQQYLQNFVNLLVPSIMKMSNKLYVNWINVQPISRAEWMSTQKFARTREVYLNQNYEDDVELYINSSGDNDYIFENRVYIGDIYNVIRNLIFERIKIHKIMIFYYVKSNKLVSYYETLSNYFNFEKKNIFTKYIDFRLMPYEDQNNFKEFCRYLRNLVYIDNDRLKIFSEDDMKLYFGVYYFNQIPFQKIEDKDRALYRNINELLYNIKNNEMKEFGDFFARNITNKELNQIYDTYINNETYTKEFFKYIQKEVVGYNSSIFTNKNFKENGMQEKIIYNFFKNWMIDPDPDTEKDGTYTLLPQNYDHLTKKQKIRFIGQINRKEIIPFNINRIELKSNGLIDKEKHQDFIMDGGELIYLIFETMQKEGILSKIIFNPKCVDKNRQGHNNKFLKRNMRENVFNEENIDKFNNCFYYLGNVSYKDLKIPNYKLNKNFTLYEHLSDEKYGVAFYTQYATNWVSQLFMYFKFLNCRVLYVTGATGVGKSTQVPKLLFYGLKAFNFKISGKMICTQPRVDPTVGIPEFVSKELGLLMKSEIEGEKVNEPALSRYLQYQHQKDKIVDNYTPTFLKFATDGLFFEQLINNPTLKEENILNLKLKSQKENPFTTKNMYDIIGVDEAHEHNKNMDYILTIMRNALYYNNDLKLVIISATMDDDEKYYRYYYRHIDDNLMYPLNRLVLNTNEDDQKFATRHLIDRRIHIEPPPVPGQSATKFPVKDIYLSEDADDYETSEKNAMKTIQNICTNTSEGHILLFTTGKKEIEKLSRFYVENLPQNILVFPYFSEMPNAVKYKGDVQVIETKLSNYNFDRSSFIDFMFKLIKEDQIKKTNVKYSRVVIIATNVAEASITIENLRFVVEMGYFNFVGYNYDTGLPIIKKEKIDENSRLQRRGRTGRVCPGTVYYMYKKNARKNVISIKNIESSNITFDYLKFLPEKSNEIAFFNKNNDPYYAKLINNNITKEDILSDFQKKKGYDQIIKTQFLYENDILQPFNLDFKDEYLVDPENDKKKIILNLLNLDFKVLYSYKETGFDPEVLFDNYGLFFITHPEESNIIRLNTFIIVQYRENFNDNWKPFNISNDIKFKKMAKIFTELIEYSFIKKLPNPYEFKKLEFIKYYKIITKSKLDFMIKNFGEKLSVVYLISKLFNRSDDILLLISLLKACDFDLRNLIYSKKGKNPKTGKIIELYNVTKYLKNIDYNSQLLQLYNIAQDIYIYMLPILQKELKSKNIYINLQLIDKLKIKEFIEIKDYNDSIINSISYKFNRNVFMLNLDERKLLDKIIKDTGDNENKPHDYLIKQIDNIFTDFFKNNNSLLDLISKHFLINKKIFPEFIKTYITYKITNFFDKEINENINSGTQNKDALLNKLTLSENKPTSILNSFYGAFRLNNDLLSGNETTLFQTDVYKRENIGIAGKDKFFYIEKNVLDIIDFKTKLPTKLVLYNLLNRLNFKIIDFKKIFEKID
jgi:hypothetical protein